MSSINIESDFSIRCLPDNVAFAVQKAKLIEGSEVFADMFSCCNDDNSVEESRCIDIYESAKDAETLIRLLHDPPPTLPETKASHISKIKYELPHPTIPHPLLPRLFALADKYALKPSVTMVLHSHLAAQAPVAPLLVYGLATQYSLPRLADKASAVLASTPLESYSTEEIKVIPSAEAYHKLLLLQAYRKLKIKELLMNEELFPHGYGACSAHRVHAETIWSARRSAILPDIGSGTDVAAEMARGLKRNDRRCKVCRKAWIAATEMLAYKCQRVARRISKLPLEGQ